MAASPMWEKRNAAALLQQAVRRWRRRRLLSRRSSSASTSSSPASITFAFPRPGQRPSTLYHRDVPGSASRPPTPLYANVNACESRLGYYQLNRWRFVSSQVPKIGALASTRSRPGKRRRQPALLYANVITFNLLFAVLYTDTAFASKKCACV